MDVTDKIAVVTGGGRGIGRGIALALARHGAAVVVADINLEDATSVSHEIAETGRDSVVSLADVTKQGSIDHMVEEILGLPSGIHSYAILPIGYPLGNFGPVGRGPLADVVYQDRWGNPYTGL